MVGHGSFPKGTLGHGVTRCTELYPPDDSVPEAGGLRGPCDAAHFPSARGCLTPVGGAQAGQGVLLKETGAMLLHETSLVQSWHLQVLFFTAPFGSPRLLPQKCSCSCSLLGRPRVQGTGPSDPADVCSMPGQGGREEAGAKL